MPDPILQYQFFDKDGKAHTIDKQEYDAHSQEFAEQFPEAQMRMVDPDGQSWNIPVSNVGAAMKEGGYRMWRMKVPVKSPERKQEATPTAKPQPVTMPEGFGSLDTRQADKALTGQGRVDWEQKEPEQPETAARQLTKALKGDEQAAKAVGLDTAGKRMQEEYAYMEATGRPLENIVNTPVTAPTAEVDEDGQMLMGQTTDEQRVAQYQQAEKEKARKRLVADAVDRLQSQMEKGAAEEFKQSIKGSGNKPLNNDIDTGMMLAQYNYGNADSPEELLRRLNEAYGYEDQEEREARDEELRKQGKSTVIAHWDDKQKNLDFANRFLEDNREAIEDTASRLNMSVDDYVLDELVPSLAGEIAERYGKNMSEKYSVKDTADFLAREMGNSIIGTLATMGATTKKTRQFMQEELQKSREGKGEHYNSNFGTNLAGETLMFAADAVPLMIGGTIGSYTAEGVGKAISALGKKELGALVASGSPFLAANVGKAVKYGGMAAGAMARGIGSMAPFMAASGAVHDMSTGDGTLSSIGKAALEGAWEGAKFGAATGAFGVGSGAAMSKLSGAAKRAALMGASFLVENQIFTGLDYISDPDNFNWSESTENAFYMQLASKFSSAHGVKGVVSKFKSLFAPKAGAPVRLTDTDKESIQRAFAGEDFETIASDVNNIGKILSDKQVIPWTTRMKVAAQTMNTSEPSRPRTSVISITPSKELVERAADGELIEVHKFDTPEQMAEIRQMIEERQANDDMLADFGKLSTMQAQEVTPDIIRLASDEVLQLSPEIRPEDVQPGGKSYDLVIDRAREIANPALDILGQFARDYDMTVDEVRSIMEKRPIERTDEETDLMNELSVRLHEAAYPKGEPHPTQSRIDGESLAGDEPTINPETSTMVAQELEESRQAYLEALGKNEDIATVVRQMEWQGARLDDIYMYVRENFSGPDADRILESIADYANAQAKQEGYIEKTGSNIDETVNQDIIEKSFHGTIDDAPDEDHIITINRDGESLILINGNIGTRDGVAVDPGKSGGMVIARTEDGRWVSLKPDALMTITERVPKDEYGDTIREQMQLDATRTAVETGLVKPEEEQPETEQPAEKMEETEADGEAGITNDTGADEPPASPLSRIPVVKDETGQPVLDEEGDAQYQFDKAPLEDTLAALDEISGGDKATVSSIVDDMLTQSAKDVEKASKLTPKGKDPIKIARSAVEIKEQQAEAQRKLDYWTEAKQVLENANKPESELNNQPEKNNEPQNSVALQPKAATTTVEEQKQRRIAEAKEQYGDLFDDDFTKANDVYELASMWVGRKRNLAWEDVNGKRGLQKELGWTRRIGGDTKYIETLLAKNGEGVGIDEFAHMVWESPENDVEGEKRFTSEEIKDAILELLKSAQSKSDVVDYALNTRIEQAKRYLEEQKAAEKEAIENKEVEPVTLTDEEKESMDNMLPFPGETDEMPEPIDVPDKPIDEKEVQSPDLKETYKEVSDEIKTRRLRVMTSEEDVKALEDAGVGNEIIGRIKADLEDPEVTGRYVPELGEVLLYDEHIKNLGLDKDEQRGVIYHEHVHGLEREGFTKENFADTARLIEEANKEFAEAVREDHKDKDKDVQDEEILGYLIQDIIRKGYKDALFDGTLDVGSEELNKRLYEIGKLLRGIKDGREREKESEVSVADEGGSRPDDQERVDETPNENTEAQETGRDDYLKPRNEKEEKIISDVEAKLAEDIKAKEEEVRKAKADLEKAKARESDKATDIFANDDTFREEDQIFSSEEMGLDTSVEGVEKRTKAERDALAAAEQELDKLRSQAEHDSRVRGALENERRQVDAFEREQKPAETNEPHFVDNVEKAPKGIQWGEKRKDKGYNYTDAQLGVLGDDLYIRQSGTYKGNPRGKEIIYRIKDYKKHAVGEVLNDIVEQTDVAVPRHVNDLLEQFYHDNQIDPHSHLRPAFTEDVVQSINHAADSFKAERDKELGITTDETPEQIAETEGEAMLVDEPLLTEGDIDSTSLSSVQKTWAKAYLKGRTDNELYLEAYLEAKEDVRNRRQDNEGGSPDADGTQLAGTDDRTERGSGRTGEPSVNMADGTDVSGKESGIAEQGGVSGVEDRPVDVPVTSGERGDSRVPEQKPEVDRLPAGGEQSVGGSGARSDGSAVRPDGAGQRGSGVAGQADERDIKTRRADLKNRRDELLARLRKLKSKEKESGRLQMAVLPPIPSGISSFIPKDKEQRKVFWELATTTADYGYTYLEEGLTKFKEWKDKIVEDFVEPIRDFFGWGQNEVDRYIEQVWASDYEINGVTRTMAEWASFLEPKKLKGYVAKDIKSKYEAQLAAESVETKVGDIDNIRESLPYLLPEQHGDVLKAEQQFFDEKHQDREHAYGKGMMFTNGTGTGKTYTGLGIVKRFVKQGKGRILILTPSQEKVNDWRMDGQNLGLDLESLDEEAKVKGTSATKAKGKGVVVTTYANARQNLKMLEDCFDLIVYDESHKIMESKEASATTMADFHEMLTNKNVERSIDRQTYWLPEWIEYRDLTREVEDIRGQLDELNGDGSQEAIDTRIRLNARMVEIQNRFEELRPIMAEIRESKRPQAEIDSKRTKVVFLSATPFNVRESLRYAEGYLFSYPEEDKNTIGSYNHRSPEDMFMEQMFPAGYRWRYGRLENHVSNAEALGRQEVQFSDYLQNTLRTVSGRMIASDYDYSRDFPIMTLDHAGRFNQAMSEVYRNKKYNKLSEAFRKCFDYNYSTALFEAMKTSLVNDRIKEHLKRGQKVVVFHRRRTSGDLEPPFRRALNYAEELAEKDQNPKTKSELLSAVKAFETDFADMLEWEKTLDYTLPREQIEKVFGSDKVAFFSGAESKKTKHKSVEEFMKDNGGKDIIVIQEASGKEGISLHDQTGEHQRVEINLALPQSPIAFIQIEGRIYRIGNMSNAIFEYPLLGLDLETSLFAQRFNSALGTTENLALGSQARNLRKSIAESVLMNTGEVDYDHQGLGGKDMDGRVADPGDKDGFDIAIQDYYGNQKISRGRDNREGVDYFPTPEPIGYKMVEFGQMLEGETALEPSAGHGAIARYVPETNGLTAVEPSANLFTKLQMRAGGPGRRFEEMTFEEYPLANKHDVILMNPPYGTSGVTAMEHVAKAFRHLNEGGRIVAIIPNGPAMDKRMNAWLESKDLNGSAVVTGEMILPNIAFGRAGTNVWTRLVVIDKVTRPEMRRNMPEKVGYDFSRETDINELFERIRNTRMPERTIDQVAINEKRVRRTEKQLSDNPFVTSTFIGTDYMDKPIMSVTTRSSDRSLGMRFSLSNYSMDDVLDTYKTVKEYGEDPESVDWGKWKNREFGRGKDKVKATDAIRDYCDTAIKTIENLTRMTSDQLDKALTEREEERARKRKEQEEKWKREQAEREARAEEERRQRIAKRDAAKEALKENFSGDDLETLGHMIDLAHQEIFGARRYREMLKNRGVDWETGKKITTPRVVLRESYNEKMPLDLGTMETLMDIAETSIDSRRKDAAKRALEMSGIHSDTGEEKENFDYSSHDEYYEKELRDFLEKASFTVKLKTKAQKAEEAEVYKRLEAEAKANTDERQNRSDYEYSLDKNTRTGDDMHLVKYNGARLGNEDYKAVERKAKANGGYYNRFKKAWHFPTEEDARKFVDGMTNVTNNTDNGAVRFSEVKDKEKLNNRGEDMESEKKNVSLPQNNVKYEEGDRERVFAGNEAVMRTVAETSDSGVRDSSTEEVGRGSGSKESVLRSLVQRAQENGTWRDSIDDEVSEYVGEGQENHVYLSKDGTHVIKLNNLKFVPEDASDLSAFVDRLRAHNELFPADAMELLGFTENAKGEVSAIIRQPFVDAEREATDAEIDKYLEDHDFTVDMTDEWSDGKYGVIDLKPSNILVDKNGRLRFVDVVVRDMDRQKSRTRFKEGEEPYYRQRDAEVLRRAERLSKKLNAPVKVATSANDVTNREASEAIRSGRKIQGWYDTKTGEVTLYLPNIKSTYDGEKVISHEIIGHKGMRDLLGENGYKSYMRSLLFDLKDKDLSEYLAKNLSRNGFDIYRTVDEFLAEAAERGYGDLPMWQKVKEKLTDALRSIGFTMSPSISDVKYMVWLSKHNLERGNIMNKVERDALLYKLGKERYSANVRDGEYTYSKEKTNDVPYFPGNGETLFRQTPSIKNQRQNYERALKRLGYVWKEAHIDAMQSAVELMRSISGIKKIEDIPSAENFVLLENQMSSKEEQMDYLFNRDYMEPLDKAVSDILPDMGRDIDDQLRNLQLYMIKKHGLERNRVLFVRDVIRALRKDSAADQNQVDQLEADYNKTVGMLRDDLRLGVTDLKDYFEDMDDWIRANIDPDYKPGEKDYSGLTELSVTGKMDSVEDEMLIDEVMGVESMLGEDRVKNLWDKTRAVSQFGLDMEYEGGLDSREKHDKVSDMFEWYVPLRGYEEKSAEDVYDYLEENGSGRKWAGPVLANAKGRESLADVDVFATLGAMSSSAINRALRNQMKQAFARFVRNHYNDVDADKRLVTELPYLWAEKQTTAGNEEWVEKFPDIPEGASADDIADILDRYNQDMQMLESQGLAKRVRQSANIPFRPAKAENKAQHIVDVWINGEKHPFVINGNPRAAQAINGQLKGERKGNLLWLSDLSHFMAKMNTSYSPDFIMRNTERDLFFSAANIAVKENFEYWKNWAKNYAVATGRVAAGVPGMETNLFNRYRNDNLDMSNPTDRYFKEFMENGGETGFVEQKNLDKWKKIVKEGVKKDSKAEEIGKKIVNALPDVIEAMNERAENLARFATYMTSRQMGRTITRSVSDAKEVSVNFNRKGSGSKVVGMNKGESHRPKWVTSANDYLAGWSAQNLQDYLMFYNAGVQGINNMTKSVVNNPVKGAAAMAAFALAGMIMPRLNQFLYEEDDDKSGKEPENPYAELPEYVRRNNLCIYGNNGSFLTVALPIELRAFYGLGDMAASYISNPELRSTRNAGVDILAQLSQIMPVNFLEGGDFSLWNLSPSGAAPLLEAARNENWLGQPIERGETPWNVYDPRWTRAFKNVSDVYVGASKKLNAATNPYNDENIKGWADGAITDPALVEHVVNGYFGGVGSTVNRVAQLAKHAGEMSPKDAITSNWMPIVRTQHFTPDERTRYARTRNKWYYYKEEAEKTDKVIKALKKRGEADPLSFMQAVSEEEGRKGTRSEIMKAAEKQYNHIKKIMDAETDLQQKNLYQLQMDQIMEQTVKELDKIR